jgi:uncharacterized protein (DUF2267 family)
MNHPSAPDQPISAERPDQTAEPATAAGEERGGEAGEGVRHQTRGTSGSRVRSARRPATSAPTGIPGAHPLVRAIAESGALPGGISAGAAASAVLCVLSQRLGGDQSTDLVNALPGELSTYVRRCALHTDHAGEPFDADEFRRRVSDHLPVGDAAAGRIAQAVLTSVRRFLADEGLADRVPILDPEGVAR